MDVAEVKYRKISVHVNHVLCMNRKPCFMHESSVVNLLEESHLNLNCNHSKTFDKMVQLIYDINEVAPTFDTDVIDWLFLTISRF